MRLLFTTWLEGTRQGFVEEERGFDDVLVGMCFWYGNWNASLICAYFSKHLCAMLLLLLLCLISVLMKEYYSRRYLKQMLNSQAPVSITFIRSEPFSLLILKVFYNA
jgi:hypothetical protein